LLPELSELLPPPLDSLADANADRHRIFRAIAELLRALGPTICVLEDLHWSDEGLGDLIRFLVAQLPDELCLVLTYRGEDLPSSAGPLQSTMRLPPGVVRSHLRLTPLGPQDVRDLVSSMLDFEGVSLDFARYLHERTLGLPFAVEEVVHLLADRRDLLRRDGRWARKTLDELAVPTAVHDFTLGRLVRLHPDARRVTQAAAVVGVPAPAGLLQHVAGLSAARAATGLAEALARILLHESRTDRFGLRHALAQRVVYGAIETPLRQLMHQRAAHGLEASEGDPPLAQIAYHLQHAGQVRRWLGYAEAAADLATSLNNHSAACDLLVEALGRRELSPTSRARMAVKLGRAALGSLKHDQALAVLQRVRDGDGLPTGLRGEIRLYIGLLLDNQAGQASAGLAELARAVPELRRRPGLAARAMSALAIPMSTTGHLADHLGWMSRALEAADRAQDPMLRTAVLVNRATVLVHVGDPRAWRAVLDVPQHAESAEAQRQLLRASGNLAHACTCTGHYGPAESFLRRALALPAEARDPYLALSLESTEVLLDWMRGRWAGLEARARKLADDGEDVPLVVAEAKLVLGLLLLARGEIVEATAELASARAIGSTGGSVPVVVAAAGALARMQLARGDVGAAAEDALTALDLVERKGIWVWAAEVAPAAIEALLALGRRAEAVVVTEKIAHGLRGRDAPAAQAALALCRALLIVADGQAPSGAARALLRAERMWRALPRPFDAARCREERAGLLLRSGEPQATDLLLSTLTDYQVLGAEWDAARVRRSLREHGVLRPWRGGRKGYGSRLSPREEEVLKLAALGRTNREIADALVLSPRTIESHLAKGMRKIGVRSRRALATEED
ncbi:MAG TPA: LuxR C-terminal-related transcriptional regulator, partial [Actinomycetes bacterium]|nr:LuxR C-terminal-related transcriptional regulator [Actinomycetes bacterium]